MTDIELINRVTSKLQNLDNKKVFLILVTRSDASQNEHTATVLDISDYTLTDEDIQIVSLSVCFLAASLSSLRAIGVVNGPREEKGCLTLELNSGLLVKGVPPYTSLTSFSGDLSFNNLNNFFVNGLRAKSEAEKGNRNYLYNIGLSFQQICKAEEIFYKISSNVDGESVAIKVLSDKN